LHRPGAWKNEVVKVRSPWRMCSSVAPSASAMAAAAWDGLTTVPVAQAGYATGIVARFFKIQEDRS
jgi:hypothetical protein